MRLKSGCKVEVMNSSDMPISWHTAELLSENDYTYTVRYDSFSMSRSPSMELTVPWNSVRPCPPPVQSGENWAVGDLVEVCLCNVYSWKVACVLKILRGEHFFVRLLGCSQELVIHRSAMRRRQLWRYGYWVLLPKGSRNIGAVKSKKPSSSTCYQKVNFQSLPSDRWANVNGGKGLFGLDGITRLQDSNVTSSRSLKRKSPDYTSTVESCTGNSQKLRAFRTTCKRQRVVQSHSPEKVDAVAYPRVPQGEKYMHASSNVRSNGYNEMYKESLDRTSEYSDSDSESSVGSCSVASSSPIKHGCYFVPAHHKVSDTLCSDAESTCHSEDEDLSNSPLPEGGSAETVHRIELHAYHCTLQALYASGPLSWDQEALLTNLRTELHISNDEHLMELKNLLSAKASNSFIR